MITGKFALIGGYYCVSVKNRNLKYKKGDGVFDLRDLKLVVAMELGIFPQNLTLVEV